MISCTEFIPIYSELFWYLDGKEGHDAVVRYWDYLADMGSPILTNLARDKGMAGCWEYWCRALSEEASDVYMEYDDEAQTMVSHMRHCPSRGRLNDLEQMEPYYDYCSHCQEIYARILGPLGITYRIDITKADNAECGSQLWVTKNANPPESLV